MADGENLITRVGRALYGDNWQAQMAREIGVHRDTVQDWRQDRSNPRPGVYVDVLKIARERQVEMAVVVEMLEHRVATPERQPK